MSIRPLSDDLNIISALPDEPNDTDGLSAGQLKAKFDHAGNTIKSFINESLIPDVNSEIVELVNKTAVQGGAMPAFGETGQALVKKSNADFDWEFKHIHSIPTGGKSGFILAKSSDDDFHAEFVRPFALEWIPIASFTSPGDFSWVAPDFFGDGLPYEIGAFIIGGGGSGGIACGISPCFLAASGGASGYTAAVRLPASPGQSFSGSVGAGAESIRVNYVSQPSHLCGEEGNPSSFAGKTAAGGGFGYALSSAGPQCVAVPGAMGAQGSDAAIANVTINSFNAYRKYNYVAPACGSPGQAAVFSSANAFSEIVSLPGGSAVPGMCRNPFTEELLLAAGGSAGAHTSAWSQSAFTFEDGSKGGYGVGFITSDGNCINIIAGTATAVGSGGGAAVSCNNIGTIVCSGGGADGAVYIYARGTR